MLLLTTTGKVYFVEKAYDYEDMNKIMGYVDMYDYVDYDKEEGFIYVTPDKILHNIDKNHIYLEKGYTFNSFVKMLIEYPLLQFLKIQVKSHMDALGEFDEIVNSKDTPDKMVITKDTNKYFDHATDKGTIVKKISEGASVGTYSMNDVEDVHDYHEFKKKMKNDTMDIVWFEEHGGTAHWAIHWKDLLNNTIELTNAIYFNKVWDEPSITMLDFVYAIFDDVAAYNDDEVDDALKKLNDDEDDENIETDELNEKEGAMKTGNKDFAGSVLQENNETGEWEEVFDDEQNKDQDINHKETFHMKNSSK